MRVSAAIRRLLGWTGALGSRKSEAALAALRDSEARFRSVLDESRDVIYRLDRRTGRYAYVSPSAARVLGIPAVELLAMDVQRALDAGFDRHLPKPPTMQKIEEVLSELATVKCAAS